MDPPPPAFFTGRRRSSVGLLTLAPSPPAEVAPRKASTWDDTDAPLDGNNPSASQISFRRASVNSPGNSTPENSDAERIAGRKGSNWDDYGNLVAVGGGSLSEIAGRRATENDQPPWDRFSGPPPGQDGSTCGWMSDIDNIAAGCTTLAERNKVFYTGNVKYIFDTHNGNTLSIGNFHALMNAYGVVEERFKDISKKIDPKMDGFFSIDSLNKQILLTENTTFFLPTDPLETLRHASKCLQENLLSPIHFSGYIFDIFTSSRYIGKPPFMLLGMYGIFGILRGYNPTSSLTTKDVETFTTIWKVLKPEEVEEIKLLIIEDYNGSISCHNFYNLLYRRNIFGKQRIQAFDTKKGPLDLSLYLFTLMHKDKDVYIFENDIRVFSAIFGRAPSDEDVGRVIRELDFDGDGKVSVEDISRVMTPVLDGITWEFWLIGFVFALKI